MAQKSVIGCGSMGATLQQMFTPGTQAVYHQPAVPSYLAPAAVQPTTGGGVTNIYQQPSSNPWAGYQPSNPVVVQVPGGGTSASPDSSAPTPPGGFPVVPALVVGGVLGLIGLYFATR